MKLAAIHQTKSLNSCRMKPDDGPFILLKYADDLGNTGVLSDNIIIH